MLFRAFAFAMLATSAALQGQSTDKAQMIFFDWGKTELSSDARSVLDRVARRLQESPRERLTLVSHTDRSGGAGGNLLRSRVRGELAKAYLMAQGVSGDRLTVIAKGESTPLVATADGVREIQNRRVELVIAN